MSHALAAAALDHGQVLARSERHDEAIERFQRAIEYDPDLTDAFLGLGDSLRAMNRLDEAEDAYLAVLERRPSAAAHYGLGMAHRLRGRFGKAIQAFETALRLDPNSAETHKDLGVALRAMSRHDEALAAYDRALEIRPDWDVVYNNKGNLLRDKGDFQGAVDSYRRCAQLNPQQGMAYYNVGTLHYLLGHTEKACQALEKALTLMPGHTASLHALGGVLCRQSRLDEALATYDRALAIADDPGVRISKALSTYTILPDKAAIPAIRDRLERELTHLQDSGRTVQSPGEHVTAGAFLLAYHGLNNRDLKRLIADTFASLIPSLRWQAPHCERGRPRKTGPIRVGMVSQFFNQHIVGTIFRGLVAQFDRSRFHVTLVQLGNNDDKTVAIQEGADAFLIAPRAIYDIRAMVAAQEFDVLIYPEIGMDDRTYLLAFARLAPVQAVLAGHPDTTGLPEMDYFLSTGLFETPEADAHYTEQLIRLPRPPVYYYRPKWDPQPDWRATFQLDPTWHLYSCPQTLFKFHPDFDPILTEILRQDPVGRLIILQGSDPNWTPLLLERLQRNLGDLMNRVIVLPQMPFGKFMGFLSIVDVLLDPVHFGGGTTSLAASTVGTPIVTLPGEFMRGRVTAGLYWDMGVTDTIATNPADYVAKAVRLANDPAWRADVKQRLQAASDVLFEDQRAVTGLQDFLVAAVEAARTGSRITQWPDPER